jgi:hypothetical protein
VKREYQVQLRNEQNDLAYRKLRQNYDVTFEATAEAPVRDSSVIATAQTGHRPLPMSCNQVRWKSVN